MGKVAKTADTAAPVLESKASAASGSAQGSPAATISTSSGPELTNEHAERRQKRLERFSDGKLSDTEPGKRDTRAELVAASNGSVRPTIDEAERRRQREKRFADPNAG